MGSQLVSRATEGKILTRAEAEELMEEILAGRMGALDVVGLLLGMNRHAPQAQELVGFAGVTRKHAAKVFADDSERPGDLVDTCGTGGDGCDTFNISTAAAIVAAAAGAKVAKHGNRASSSRCGSADVLEALGVHVGISPIASGQAIRKLGLGFLYARTAHSAARHAAPARKEIAGPTIFNLLGPLTNPAGASFQVVGVNSDSVLEVMAQTLGELGVLRALVVHGAGGMDEISLAGETQIVELNNGAIKRFVVTPEEFGVKRAPLEELRGGDAAENASIISRVLAGEPGARRDVVVVNAAAALVVSGNAVDFAQGTEMSAKAISSGAAKEKLAALVAFTNRAEETA